MSDGPERARTKRILIVDDFAPVADLMADALRRSGYRTSTANSAAEALTAFDTTNYDLVVSDIVMPGMSGWELMRRLRERHGPVQGIVVSALHAPEHRTRSRASGFTLHLAKPLDLDVLLETVENVFRQDGIP